MTDPAGRGGRRSALVTLITRKLEKEMQHEDEKTTLALLLGEATQQLANVDRIAHALERIADALEAGNLE
jgi:hypothetical protein